MATKNHDGFFQQVFDVCQLIPYGRVTSYGAIANYLSSGGASRMVGWALNASHHSQSYIPAHRVVNRNGFLTGKSHFGSPNLMKELLEQEGVKVENDRVVGFKELFWNPSTELIGLSL